MNQTGLRNRHGNPNTNTNNNKTSQTISENDAVDYHAQAIQPPPAPPTDIMAAFSDDTLIGRILTRISNRINRTRSPATFAGFLSLLLLTMSNYMLGPMRDAAALKVGVSYIPALTLVSTILALASSVPVGWLFEAPNPERKGRSWRDRIGLTRGETQGTSLALFLRCFAVCPFGYAFSFKLMDLWSDSNGKKWNDDNDTEEILNLKMEEGESIMAFVVKIASFVLIKCGKAFYVMFFLVVHLMKLHSISLMWGVTSEAMEYEEQAELRAKRNLNVKARSNSINEEVGEKPVVGGKSR